MPIITSDVRAVIDSAHLCFAATVTADGYPNLSPKGTIRVWDDDHVYFLDIASPGTRANLAHRPYIELNVVDQLSRRGYRLFGSATLHRDDAVYNTATERVRREEQHTYPVACVVLVHVERAGVLASPGYMHIPTESQMRQAWRERRAVLDEAFERHAAAAPFVPPFTRHTQDCS